ncbi:hypothetical protein C8J57DRAFT_1564393 [Mycena rebaudengoi]|nr:hypothetical protein C8J57DRAFT_1564393 [Mycena rebaudengoi]
MLTGENRVIHLDLDRNLIELNRRRQSKRQTTLASEPPCSTNPAAPRSTPATARKHTTSLKYAHKGYYPSPRPPSPAGHGAARMRRLPWPLCAWQQARPTHGAPALPEEKTPPLPRRNYCALRCLMPTLPARREKTADSLFHSSPHSDKPRDTPSRRKTHLKIFTAPTPLVDAYGSPQSPESPTPSTHHPAQAAAAASSPPAARPPAAAAATAAATAAAAAAAPPVQVHIALAPLLLFLTPAAPAFVAPTHNELMVLVPVGRQDNPHCGLHEARDSPPLMADGRPPFQKNNGQYPVAVIEEHRLLDNVESTTANCMCNNREEFIALPLFNGGQRALTALKTVILDVSRVVQTLVSDAAFDIARPVPQIAQEGDWSKKYLPPFCLFLRTTDPVTRSLLMAQQTFAVNRDLAFHAVPLDPFALSWVVGLWSVLPTTARPDTLVRYLRAAVYMRVMTDPIVTARISQITQGVVAGTTAQRALAVAESADVQYIPHTTDPLFIVYLQPCTTSALDWESLKVLLRPHTLTYKTSSFTPKTPHDAPECVVCKLDTHLAYLCPFTGVGIVRDPNTPPHEWWGPPDQISKLKEGALASSPRNSSTTRGAYRGGNHTRGGGSRRRGGRGGNGGRGRGIPDLPIVPALARDPLNLGLGPEEDACVDGRNLTSPHILTVSARDRKRSWANKRSCVQGGRSPLERGKRQGSNYSGPGLPASSPSMSHAERRVSQAARRMAYDNPPPSTETSPRAIAQATVDPGNRRSSTTAVVWIICYLFDQVREFPFKEERGEKLID